LAVYLLSGLPGHPLTFGPFHHHLAQARAFLDGRLDLKRFPPDVELAYFDEKAFVVLPPGPSVVLMPLVALGDSRWNLVPLHGLLSASSGLLMLGALRRRGASAGTSWTTAAAFGFGTVLWWVTCQKGAWHTAQVMSVFSLCLALWLVQGGRAPIAVGLLVGFSAICRQLTVFAAPYFMYQLLLGTRRRATRQDGNRSAAEAYGGSTLTPTLSLEGRGSSGPLAVLQFLIGAAIPLCFYLWLNYARFGNPFDTGYRYINLRPPGLDKYLAYGLFSLGHLPENLFTLLFAPPRWSEVFPYFHPDFFGQAMIFTSPFVFYAFRAGCRTREHQVLWLCIALILAPQLLYFNNGFAQFGFRFALDFLPLMMILVADGFGRRLSIGALVTVALSVGMNLLGVCTL